MKLLTLTLLIFVISCGPISVRRSFIDEMDRSEPEYFVAGKSFEVTPGDEGQVGYQDGELYKRTPDKESIYPEWSEKDKLSSELSRKMSKMSEEEKRWFEKNDHLFQSDSQKIYFLGLSEAEKENYLYDLGAKSKRVRRRAVARTPASFVRYSPRGQREIVLGMSKGDVERLWGSPHRIDVAGNPDRENERWTFFERGEKKFIYFAAGRVEGWVLE